MADPDIQSSFVEYLRLEARTSCLMVNLTLLLVNIMLTVAWMATEDEAARRQMMLICVTTWTAWLLSSTTVGLSFKRLSLIELSGPVILLVCFLATLGTPMLGDEYTTADLNTFV